MNLHHPFWARREIERLDPVRDCRRIAHLLLEVRFGDPRFVHPMFSVAFSRQVAIPAIARVLYRGGSGLIMKETARRNDDTLVFFGLLLRHGNSPEGMKVVERMNRMHARYPIPNELNLYTLSTLACLPQRLGRQFTGRDIFTGHESLALYHFWRQVGEMMEIQDIPASPGAMLQWMLDFEATEYGYTPDGQAVTRALAREYAERWFPSAMRAVGERAFLALFDDRLLTTHRLPAPSALDGRIVQAAVRGFVLGCTVLPDPAERDLLLSFGSHYDPSLGVDRVGPQGI
ncbi:MAG TPA: oxygenase MpaB family protein [Moraxellaceae bacterium]|nr:oxygenase MpaB family protein [Moraxellaceae bacterium]